MTKVSTASRSIANKIDLIDYSVGPSTQRVRFAERRPLGGVTLSRSIFSPNPGITYGSKQAIVAIHRPPAFEMEWCDPEQDRLQRKLITPGAANVNRSDLPVFHRWDTTANALVIALDEPLIIRTTAEAFDGHVEPFPIAVGIEDPMLQRIAALCEREVLEGSAAGRVYAESLGTALIVHLIQMYGAPSRRAELRKGGLTPKQLHLVEDYIESHLDHDLGLAELAALTSLSTHHFGQAFRASTGVPPHRYLINRRVSRAKELLLQSNLALAEIAFRVGFSSQSHMTLNFRKLTGITPAQFRASLGADRLSVSLAGNDSRMRRIAMPRLNNRAPGAGAKDSRRG